MNLTGRPIQPTQFDATLFIGRQDVLAQLTQVLEMGMNTVVAGQRGVGKTSLLNILELTCGVEEATDAGFRFIRVNGDGAESPSELMARVVVASGADMGVYGVEGLAHRPVDELIGDLQRWASKALASSVPVIVVDDAPATVASKTFGPHRDQLWTVGIAWLIVVRDDAVPQLLRNNADAFLDARIDIPGLNPNESRHLLHTRVPNLPEGVVEASINAADGNPRKLVSSLRAWVLSGQSTSAEWSTRAASGRRSIDGRLAELGRSATMLYAEMGSMGPVSASDDELLNRMGWSRSRAAQVLGQLEGAGLATAESVRGAGGRPKKVYSLVPAEQMGQLPDDGGDLG